MILKLIQAFPAFLPGLASSGRGTVVLVVPPTFLALLFDTLSQGVGLGPNSAVVCWGGLRN